MEMPDFQSIMLPLLKFLSDKKEYSSEDLRTAMINHFNLSEKEIAEQRLQTGQLVIVNRVAWAEVYLKHAGLIESPSRAHYKITEEGIKFLSSDPPKITIGLLRQISPTFKTFHTAKKGKDKEQEPIVSSIQTPEEIIEYEMRTVEESVQKELITKLKTIDPSDFEYIIGELLEKLGYGNLNEGSIKITGKSHDGGVDGICSLDKLGLNKAVFQAKRWENDVGVEIVDRLAGTVHKERSNTGILITTSSFTSDAIKAAEKLGNIRLIDGEELSKLMITFELGTRYTTLKIPKLNSEYFSEFS